MSILNPHLGFSKDKPFYPLIISYLTQVHGFIELASRGFKAVLNKLKEEEIENYLQNETNKISSAFKNVYENGITGLIGNQELGSKVEAKGIKINVNNLADELFENYKSPLDNFNRMTAGGLLILSWEITDGFHTKDPLWEFLRHCRNAAGHKGYFNFLNSEPKRIAQWRNLEIKRELQGTPLFFDGVNNGIIAIGDVLYLLWDIEQKFSDIK